MWDLMRVSFLVGALVPVACGDSVADDHASDTDNGSSEATATTIDPSNPTTSGPTSGSSSGSSSSTGVATASSTAGGEDSTTGEPVVDACEMLDLFVQELGTADPEAMEGMVEEYIASAQYGEHGLPLRCGERVVFVGTEPRIVAGDFNGWEPKLLHMEQPVEGAPLWLAEADVPVPGGAYKMVLDEVFTADPRARRYGWDQFGEYSQIDDDPGRSHHERWPWFSEHVEPLAPRTVRVFVPATANAGRDVPVLYMHDGQNVFSPDAFFGGWRASETADALIEDGSIRPFLIVAIDNTAARLEEYSHVEDDLGDGPLGGGADDYADFVVEGVMPFVEARYPIQTGSQNTGVLGSSMGGLVSLHLGHRYPDVFGYVGSMSGTLAWGTFGLKNETMIDRYAADPPTDAQMYVDSGGAGPCPDEGSDNYCENTMFADLLRSLGWTDEADLFYRWVDFAPHNEAAWAERLPGAFVDWFPGA